MVFAGPVEHLRQIAQRDRVLPRGDAGLDLSGNLFQQSFVGRGAGVDDLRLDQPPDNGHGKPAVRRDRGVDVVEKKLLARRRVAKLSATPLADEPLEIDHRHVQWVGGAADDVRYFADRPQRADVLVDGPAERGARLVEPLQLQQHAARSPVKLRVARVDLFGAAVGGQGVFELSVAIQPPGALDQPRPALEPFVGKPVGVPALEGRKVLQIRGGRDQHDGGAGAAGDVNDAREVDFEVFENLPALVVVALVRRGADRVVQRGVDFLRHFETLGVLRVALPDKHSPHQRVGPRSGERSRDGPPQERRPLDVAIRALFEELVLPGVDDQQVGLVPGQLLGQSRHSIAGVADPSGVDDLPGRVRRDAGQQLAQPAAKRRGVVVRPAVRGRAAKAEYAPRGVSLLTGEALVVEPGKLAGRGDHPRRIVRIGIGHKQVRAAREADEGIAGVDGRLDADQRETALERGEEQQRGEHRVGEFLPPTQPTATARGLGVPLGWGAAHLVPRQISLPLCVET